MFIQEHELSSGRRIGAHFSTKFPPKYMKIHDYFKEKICFLVFCKIFLYKKSAEIYVFTTTLQVTVQNSAWAAIFNGFILCR